MPPGNVENIELVGGNNRNSLYAQRAFDETMRRPDGYEWEPGDRIETRYFTGQQRGENSAEYEGSHAFTQNWRPRQPPAAFKIPTPLVYVNGVSEGRAHKVSLDASGEDGGSVGLNYSTNSIGSVLNFFKIKKVSNPKNHDIENSNLFGQPTQEKVFESANQIPEEEKPTIETKSSKNEVTSDWLSETNLEQPITEEVKKGIFHLIVSGSLFKKEVLIVMKNAQLKDIPLVTNVYALAYSNPYIFFIIGSSLIIIRAVLVARTYHENSKFKEIVQKHIDPFCAANGKLFISLETVPFVTLVIHKGIQIFLNFFSTKTGFSKFFSVSITKVTIKQQLTAVLCVVAVVTFLKNSWQVNGIFVNFYFNGVSQLTYRLVCDCDTRKVLNDQQN